MELYLDTANLDDIERFGQLLPIRGVTTNPSIVAASGRSLTEIIAACEDILGGASRYHAQVLATDYRGMLRDAERIAALADDMVVKIPVSHEGFRTMKTLSKAGYRITATAIYSPHQAFLAALCGASYVAPYINRIDALARNGLEVVNEIQALLDRHQLDCKILAASFKNADQVLGAFLAGIGSVTLPGDVLQQLISSPATDRAIEEFGVNWEKSFGTRDLVI